MVLGQKPNWPLVAAAVAWAIAFISSGLLYGIFRAVFYIFFSIWAYMELFSGVNGLRRILGGVMLVYVAYSLWGLM